MANIKFTELPNLGNITPTTIVPVVAANVNYTVTAANLQTYVNSTTGNVTANYFIGNGSALTGLPATYGNSNVAAYLPTYTGNITANTISTTGNVITSFIIGDGSQLTNLPAGNYSNANVANYLPIFSGSITSVVDITATGNISGSNLYTPGVVSATGNVRGGNINTAGNVSATGNITGNYYVGNGSQLTGIISSYGNSNVQAVLQTYTGTLTAGSVSAIGNITGNYLFGNGSQITGINVATTYGNSNVSAYLASGNNTANIVTTANVQGSFVKGNGSALTGLVSSIVAGTGITISAATGAVTITNNNPTVYGNANVAAYLPTYTGNLTAGNISTTGTITGTHLGNGAGLSSIVTSISAGSGISINASTGAVTITATGGGNTSSKIAGSFATGSKGNVSEVISASVLIPANTFTTNDTVRISAEWLTDSFSSQSRYGRVYVNTANSIPATASLNVWYGLFPTSANFLYRTDFYLDVISNTSNTRSMFGNASGAIISYNNVTGYGTGSNAGSYPAIDWSTSQYIIFTCGVTGGNAAAGLTNVGYQIYKE